MFVVPLLLKETWPHWAIFCRSFSLFAPTHPKALVPTNPVDPFEQQPGAELLPTAFVVHSHPPIHPISESHPSRSLAIANGCTAVSDLIRFDQFICLPARVPSMLLRSKINMKQSNRLLFQVFLSQQESSNRTPERWEWYHGETKGAVCFGRVTLNRTTEAVSRSSKSCSGYGFG